MVTEDTTSRAYRYGKPLGSSQYCMCVCTVRFFIDNTSWNFIGRCCCIYLSRPSTSSKWIWRWRDWDCIE